MTFGLIEKAGGWRSLISGFIIFSFLALAGLLAISGHLMHQFLAVVYLLVAAFVMTRVAPRRSDQRNNLEHGPKFQPDGDSADEPSGCHCHDQAGSSDMSS